MTGPRSLRGRLAARLPTSPRDWRLMGRTTRLVLGRPTYAALAAVAALAALTGFVVALEWRLVADVVLGGSLPLGNRLRVLGGLYPFLGTTFEALDGGLLVLVAALAGADVAIATYHFRTHGLDLQRGGAGAAGVALGALGAGCAACGSAVLLGLLSLVGVSVSLVWLPLDGLEFAMLALVALTLSIYWFAEGMGGGEIRGCPVDVG